MSMKSGDIDGFEPARRAILEAALVRAPYEGWSRATMGAAAREAGIEPAALAAAFPGGVGDLLTYWSEETDAAMRAAMAGPDFEPLKIRAKVAFAVRARLDLLRPHKEAARRAAAALALPIFAGLGARLAWRTADAVWRGLADKSTDFNFYTKRALLAGVWTATLARWFADDAQDEAATRDFLDARIENVMQIEKLKKRVKEAGFDPEGLVGWLGKLRYPVSKSASQKADAKVDEALKESFPASDPPYWTP
ncbi:MAG: COQ9 family protein [Amphiplicatus sp.]